MAHDEGDFEGPDSRSLMDEFMAKMAQSVNDDYKNLHALLATLPDPSVDTGTHPMFFMCPTTQCTTCWCHRDYWIRRKTLSRGKGIYQVYTNSILVI